MSNTEKIFVDLNEDIVFAIERIKNSSADKVIVIVPRSANLTSSLISLKLLSRQVLKTNKVVSLVTDDSIGQKLGKKAGLMVVENVQDIDSKVWEEAKNLKEEGKSLLEKTKRNLLDKRSEKPEVKVNEYKIVDENEPVVETLEEDVLAQQDEEIRIVRKNRIPARVIAVGGIKFYAAGDLNQNEELLNELLPKVIEPVELESNDREENSIDNEDRPIDVYDENEPEVIDESKYSSEIVEDEEIEEEKTESNSRFQRKKPLIGQNLAAVSAQSRPKRDFGSNSSSSRAESMAFLTNVIDKIKDFFAVDPKRKFYVGGGLALLLVLFFFFGSKSSVEVRVTVKQDAVSIAETITAQTTATVIDPTALTIPAEARETEDESSESASATGTGTKGEKAKGQVDIYNKTAASITLPAGTALTIEGSGLVYITGAAVTIPPEDPGFDPGKVEDVNIEAEKHGTPYNAPSNKSFTVGSYPSSQVAAKNFRELTGGTSEETVVVSEQDLTSLKEVLTKRIESTATSKLESLAGADEIMVPNTVTVEILEESSTKKAGEEASRFDINMKAKIKAVYVKKANVETIVKEIAKQRQEIEGESEINISQFPQISDVTFENGVAKFKVTSNASAKSALNKEKIVESISGKSLGEADKFLKDQPDVIEYDIKYSPWYTPSFLKKVPAGDSLNVRVTAK